MSRWLPVAAIVGAALVIVALLLVALRPGAEPSAAQRADGLAAELRCPDCQGLSVADSPTDAAREIRRQIDELVAAGATDAEVRGHFTDRYGEWILLAPSASLTWVVPFAVVGIGVAAVAAWLLARQGRAPAPPGASPLAEGDRRRLHDEAEALDA